MKKELEDELLNMYMEYIHSDLTIESYSHIESLKCDLDESEIIKLIDVGRVIYKKFN